MMTARSRLEPLFPACDDDDVIALYPWEEKDKRHAKAYYCLVHRQVFTDGAYLKVHQLLALEGKERRNDTLPDLGKR